MIIIKSLLIAAVIATIICAIIWVKHRPVKVAKNATYYLDKNTVNITYRHDRFITSNTQRIPINRN